MTSTGFPTYEEEHSQFVSTVSGTTNVEVVSLFTSVALLPLLTSLLFPWLIPVKLGVRCGQDPVLHLFLSFLIEYPIIVILPCFLTTFFTSDVHGPSVTTAVTVTIFMTCLLILTFNHTLTSPTWTSLSNEWKQLKDQDVQWNRQSTVLTMGSIIKNQNQDKSSSKVGVGNGGVRVSAGGHEVKPATQTYPFVTNLRGMINYTSIICILAVDFLIFPRRFAKTQKYGVSVMDIGTASYIFGNGIVSPEAKNRRPNFKKSIMSSIPLFVLGFGRLLAIKGTEYHEVTEEYGVHWNFFFTLASVKILSTIIFTIFHTKSALKLFIATGLIYEACLLQTRIQESYLLNPSVSREASLINANREGIFSSLGYLSIYLSSVYTGQRIFGRQRKTVDEWTKYLLELGWQGTIAWLLFYSWNTFGNPSCRRVANLSYILWAVAISYTVLFANLFVSMTQTVAQKLGILHGPMISYHLYLKNLKESDSDAGSGHFESPYQNQTQEHEARLSAKYRTDNFHKLANKTEAGSGDRKNQVDQHLNKLNKKLKQLKRLRKKKETPNDKESLDFEFVSFEEELEALGQLISEESDIKNEHSDDENTDTDSDSDGDTLTKTEKKFVHLPDLSKSSLFYEATGFNGLIVFLLANLLTGLVNYSILTMYARPILAILILVCYASTIYFTSFLLYWFNIRLKFW